MKQLLALVITVCCVAVSPNNVADLHVRWQVKLGTVADTAPLVAGNTLYITATTSVYKISTRAHGFIPYL